ncbi:DinB family protein [Alicyclobacillus sendaiensis]|uniref:DinB family protein n=1 Tax=Alicyclobacillus sendaiensis PA2 TaxID=3029425 RepID=A0ABT6XWW6_ALISE|nr:DinB family protein [Alicyclobacillus sendaiensis]MDI9259455.1 DinB family protein [Alicyclobacillus sendaiensis PA2]
MLKEMQDLHDLYLKVHATIHQMVDDLTDEQWVKKPADHFNNIASILEHTLLVERRFFAQLKGETPDIDARAPFLATSWDVAKIKSMWAENERLARDAFAHLTAQQLDEPGAKLGVGEVNKRQLAAYAIAHTAHHRGQIPLVKKLLGI